MASVVARQLAVEFSSALCDATSTIDLTSSPLDPDDEEDDDDDDDGDEDAAHDDADCNAKTRTIRIKLQNKDQDEVLCSNKGSSPRKSISLVFRLKEEEPVKRSVCL